MKLRIACLIALAALSAACKSVEGVRERSLTSRAATTRLGEMTVQVVSTAPEGAALARELRAALAARGLSGQRQVLEVRNLTVSRERIEVADIQRGWGMITNPNEIWRVRVRFDAVVKGARSGQVFWTGVGEAEDISSPRRTEIGFVTVKQKARDRSEDTIRGAAEGLAERLAGR